jgi:hypothetical protein
MLGQADLLPRDRTPANRLDQGQNTRNHRPPRDSLPPKVPTGVRDRTPENLAYQDTPPTCHRAINVQDIKNLSPCYPGMGTTNLSPCYLRRGYPRSRSPCNPGKGTRQPASLLSRDRIPANLIRTESLRTFRVRGGGAAIVPADHSR